MRCCAVRLLRYDVTAALVGCPPASLEAEENRDPNGGDGAQNAGGYAPRASRGGKLSPEAGRGGGRHERGAWKDTPNAELLVALSR